MDNDFKNKDEDGIRYSFNIKYNGTISNKETHKRFKEFCKEEADDVYLLGIKKLLDEYEQRWIIDEFAMRLKILEQEIELLKSEPEKEEPKKKVIKTFGSD